MNSSALRSPAPTGSLFGTGNTNKNSQNKTLSGTITNAVNSVVNSTKSMANSFSTNTSNTSNASNASNTSNKMNFASKLPSTTYIVLIIGVFILFTFLTLFWKQIREGLNVMYEQIRHFFGAAKAPPPSNQEDSETVTHDPVPPQDEGLNDEKKLIEKILPGRQQVFNISKNNYTYYDAEPLCKALGSDLATYEQVKQAYASGADWCNYGWVKGQMAVYPTQSDTWSQLQSGPEEQRSACGSPGINGGYFDNPELKFGVSCYGIKPDQKDHDATAVASGEGAPLSPSGLEFDKKVSKYRGEANSISILPFSKSSWSA
jgi:hypothetical protein